MANIYKKLLIWEKEGLISLKQVEDITAFEEEAGKPWVMYGFIILGITIISIGILSLIAANWENLSGEMKVACNFIVLILVALGIYFSHKKGNSTAFDGLASLFFFLYLASIGLVSQVFHTGGQLYEALFLWVAVTFPLVLFARKGFLPAVWVFAMLSAVIVYCITGFTPDDAHIGIRIGFIVSVPLLSASLGGVTSNSKVLKKFSGPFFFWAVLAGLGGLFTYDIFHTFGIRYDREIRALIGLLTPLFIVVYSSVLSFAVVFSINRNISSKTRTAAIICGLIFLGMMLVAIPVSTVYETSGYYRLDHGTKTIIKLVGPLFTIIMLLALSFLFTTLGRRRLFNLCLNLTGIRFLFIYFQVFGSLAYTGFGLIISGLFIIACVYIWKKNFRKIEAFAGRFLN